MDITQLNDSLIFIQRAENLKNTLRYAYTSTGRPESTAEHTWRLCLLIMVFSKYFEGADLSKLLRLAVIHDLGEAVCGDVPAIVQSEGDDKSLVERRGMCDLCDGLPEAVRSEFMALWDEYEGASTLEARLVKGLDKLETIMQHNQGANPPGFDYNFNLTYGLEYTSAHPLLNRIRELVDKETRAKAAG
ncbi:phosphohydrolase [Deltaproteobacteria bacterium Smac51]|nr:phosphohydrolase [Deltaproteobacteria bacterium Smac51]